MDPAAIGTYQIDVVPQTVAGNAVLVPNTGGQAMREVLDMFRGGSPVPTTEVAASAPETSAATDVAGGSSGTTDSVPVMFPGDPRGIVPPTVTC